MNIVRGKRVTLRLLHPSFFNEYLAMFSPTVRAMVRVPGVEQELSYLQQRYEKMESGQTIFYCIFDNKEDRLIGALEIRNRDEHPGQLYNWIHENYWGEGRYQEALALACQHYFTSTNQLYFTAHVDIANKRSFYALKKFGFAQNGFHNGPHCKQYALIVRRRDSYSILQD